jgi:hypothetical protein
VLAVTIRALEAPPMALTGSTVNLSPTGLLAIVPGAVALRGRIRVWVDWPALSFHGDPLHLTGGGTVVWTKGDRVGIRIEGWHFREGPMPQYRDAVLPDEAEHEA